MFKVNGSNITTGIFKKDDTILGDQSDVTKELSLNSTPVDGVNTDKLFAFDGTTNEGKVITPKMAMMTDYQKGTWIPTVIGATTTGSCSYFIQEGIYVKTANIVYIEASIFIDGSHTGSGNMIVTGLPYNVSQSGSSINMGFYKNFNLSSGEIPGGRIESNTISMRKRGNQSMYEINMNEISGKCGMRFNGMYYTNS